MTAPNNGSGGTPLTIRVVRVINVGKIQKSSEPSAIVEAQINNGASVEEPKRVVFLADGVVASSIVNLPVEVGEVWTFVGTDPEVGEDKRTYYTVVAGVCRSGAGEGTSF